MASTVGVGITENGGDLLNAKLLLSGSFDQASEEERQAAIMDVLSVYIAIEGPTAWEAAEGPEDSVID